METPACTYICCHLHRIKLRSDVSDSHHRMPGTHPWEIRNETLSVPYRRSWTRNVLNIMIFHIILLYIHFVSCFINVFSPRCSFNHELDADMNFR